MNNNKSLEYLKTLLREINGAYPDFINGVALFSRKYGTTSEIIEFVENNDDLRPYMVIDKVIEINNLKSLEIID